MKTTQPIHVRLRRRLGDFRRSIKTLFFLAHQARNPAQFPKYIPAFPSADHYALTYSPSAPGDALPVPPRDLWIGYSDTEAGYLTWGKRHCEQMLQLAPLPPSVSPQRPRVLDFGCGGGRMIRHLAAFAENYQIWGVDISAEHINWLKMHLSPPFHFATTTTIPHLPFTDGYFHYIYCGSVFTHIEDLAEAWFLEIARILAPGGTFCVTLHDEHTAKAIVRNKSAVSAGLDHNPVLAGDVVVVGRDSHANVFYKEQYLRNSVDPFFEIVRIEPEAHSEQTLWVLKRRRLA